MTEQQETKDGGSNNKEVIMLRGEKLKTLAKLVHQQEVNRILNVPFKSEAERVEYLRDSQDTYESAVGLVKEATELQKKLDKNDEPQKTSEGKTVAGEFLEYVEYGVGTAIRTVYNLHLRIEYMKKLRAHAESLVPEIEDIYDRLGKQPSFALETEAQELAKKIASYKDVQYEYMLKWKNPSARNFSLALHKKGITFDKMVNKYQLELVRKKGSEYDKPFHQLDDAQKIEVYDEIAKSSGRGTLFKNRLATTVDTAAKGLLLLTVALFIWDIYSSEHKLRTGVVEGTKLVATVASGLAGEFAGVAIGTAVVGTGVGAGIASTVATTSEAGLGLLGFTIELDAAYVFICMTGMVTGFGVAFVVGSLTALLVSQFFHSGGDPATINKVSSTQNIPVYVAPMPDCDRLARQLTYQGGTH